MMRRPPKSPLFPYTSLFRSLSTCSSSWASPRTSSASTPRSPASQDRKSTRLNSSHLVISYAVICLKKQLMDKGYCGGCPSSIRRQESSRGSIPAHHHHRRTALGVWPLGRGFFF